MPVTLICQYEPCSQPFVVHIARKDAAKFCSQACYHAAKVLLPEERAVCVLECGFCHEPYIAETCKKDTSHYCSRACHYAAKRKPTIELRCGYCRCQFFVSSPRKDTAQFCSKRCRGQWESEQNISTFWDKIQRCDHGFDCLYCCWPWRGWQSSDYGTITVCGKQIRAHRRAWELGNNRTMPAHLQGAHYCHFPPCCNPWHIHPATQIENHADSVRDHRIAAGEKHYSAKLTELTVQEAFRLKILGWSSQSIGDHLGVSRAAINQLIAGVSWKDVPRPEGFPHPRRVPLPRFLS